ncbi:MAG: 2OG-Fe(II) oxygenase [Myxococcota bacterium]|nr:2OG-Fe(II) oxygenase [Myxococcota bacterium]
MAYLNRERLEALDPAAYQTRAPYPYVNPEGLLHDEAYRKLVENLPPLELFEKIYGKKRAHGQKPHDRFTLEYAEGLPLPSPWQEFVDELRDGPYRSLLCRLTGKPDMDLRFHWHWATTGDSVSPHCDARRKLGSHIFYLNREAEWDPKWGGETLVLDDDGRFSRNSSPGFEDFSEIIHARATGNRSLLFTRRGNSWHGVNEICCPTGHFRKVFIVVLEKPRLRSQVRRAFSGS